MSTQWLELGSVTGERVALRATAINAVMPRPQRSETEVPQGGSVIYLTGNGVMFAVVEPPEVVLAMCKIADEDAAREARGQAPLNGPGRR